MKPPSETVGLLFKGFSVNKSKIIVLFITSISCSSIFRLVTDLHHTTSDQHHLHQGCVWIPMGLFAVTGQLEHSS